MKTRFEVKAWFESRAMEANERCRKRLVKEAVDSYLEEHLEELLDRKAKNDNR